MKALYYYRYIEQDKLLNASQRFFIQYWLRQLDRRISSYERINFIGLRFLISELIEGLYEYKSGNLSKYDVYEIFEEFKFETQRDYVLKLVVNVENLKRIRTIQAAKDPNEITEDIQRFRDFLETKYRGKIWKELRKSVTLNKFTPGSFERIAILTDHLLREVLYLDYPLEFVKQSHFILLNSKSQFGSRFGGLMDLFEKPKPRKFKVLLKIKIGPKSKFVETDTIKIYKRASLPVKSKRILGFLNKEPGQILLLASVDATTSIGAAFKAFEDTELQLDIMGISHLDTTDINKTCLVINKKNNYELTSCRRLYLSFPMQERLTKQLSELAYNNYMDRLSLEAVRTVLRNYHAASVINYPIWIRFLLMWQCIEAFGRTKGVKQTQRDLVNNIVGVYILNYYHSRYQRFKTNLYHFREDHPKIKLFGENFNQDPFYVLNKTIREKQYFKQVLESLEGYEIFTYDLLNIADVVFRDNRLFSEIATEKKKINWSLKRALRIRNLLLHRSQTFVSQNQLQFMISDLYGIFESIVRMFYLVIETKQEKSLEKLMDKLVNLSNSYFSKFERGQLTSKEILLPFRLLKEAETK